MFKRALGLGVALVVGAMLVSASGAATTKAQKVTKINVSTRAAVVHYLRSIHVNAKHAVIQRGLRNYAGAHCPGAHWTCASTKHTVVQIAKQGGENRFACKRSKCAVVQVSGTTHGVYLSSRHTASASAPTKPPGGSTAYCVKTGSGATTGGGQTCAITQSGSGPNLAGVYENTTKVSGLVQTAEYNATITQTSSGSNANTACVTQNITLDGSTTNMNGKATTSSLNAFQTILITQNSPAGPNSAWQAATPTGPCDTTTSALAQSQNLSSTITATGNITQNQNNVTTNPQGVSSANVVTEIDQNQGSVKGSASGINKAAFAQTSNQSAIANAKSGKTVYQQQDADVPNPPFSGLVGTLNQDSSALSTASATQTETQCEDVVSSPTTPTTCDMVNHDPPAGVNLTQIQYGPEGVLTLPAHHSGRVPFAHKGYGKSQQTGNPGCNGGCDTFGLTQTSTQNADVGSGQQNLVQGDCSSTGGSCTTSQLTSLNGGTTQDGWTAPNIDNVNINCPKGQACVATPPPDPHFVSGPDDPNFSSSAAFKFTDPATGGIHFLCKIDGGTAQENVVDPCSSNTAFFQGYGQHTFQVAASDGHGNVSNYVSSTPVFTWTNVPPMPAIDSGPANGSSITSKSATFTFHDSDSSLSFVCSQTGVSGSYSACTPTAGTGSGEQDYTGPLALGTQNFYVKATDGSGHFSSPATRQWTILPTCDAGTGSPLAAYNPMPLDVTHCGPSSEGFEANADNEFGDQVTLDTTGGTSLKSLTVDLQSYGCGDSGHWNTGATDACMTTPGETFSIPITATIYSVNQDGTVGSALATSTINPNIPYRPSADPTACPGSGGNGPNDTGSKWYDSLAKACRYSVSDLVTFDNWNTTPTFTSGEQVIWTVQFDTTDAGYNPVGQQPCNLLDQGCGYDSLNVGTKSFPNAPYAGTDVSEDVAFRSYDIGYGGTLVPLQSDPNWTGFRPLGEIVLGS